jgi:hypothetical protein
MLKKYKLAQYEWCFIHEGVTTVAQLQDVDGEWMHRFLHREEHGVRLNHKARFTELLSDIMDHEGDHVAANFQNLKLDEHGDGTQSEASSTWSVVHIKHEVPLFAASSEEPSQQELREKQCATATSSAATAQVASTSSSAGLMTPLHQGKMVTFLRMDNEPGKPVTQNQRNYIKMLLHKLRRLETFEEPLDRLQASFLIDDLREECDKKGIWRVTDNN